MANKTKIDLYEPNYNINGVIYYSGIVNGVYTHFLGFDRLNKKQIKTKLLEKYNRDKGFELGE